MNRLNKLLSVHLFLVLCGCCRMTNGEQQLGSNFALIDWDSKTKKILYCTSTKCCDSGFEVVPSKVIEAKHNGNWIVAKAVSDNDEYSFWIVDKRFRMNLDSCNIVSCDSVLRAHIIGPITREKYRETVSDLGIHLELE